MAIVGIDLGTTNSAVAMLWMGRPEIIPNRYGGRTTPSVVGLTRQNKILVGHKAKHQRVTLAQPPIEEIKRQMGTAEKVLLGKRECSPEEISAYILRFLRNDSQMFLKESVNCGVITIPAYFNESARKATREAGEKAGLHVPMVLDEPTAAALAYGLQGEKDETVLVYDLGGGTFDVSVIEISGSHFEVLGISGDVKLGGKDIDRLLADYVYQVVRDEKGIKLPELEIDFARFWGAVEACKCDLSFRMDSAVILEALLPDLDVYVEVKRELLEEIIRPLVHATLKPVEEALRIADLDKEDIDHVIMVGGGTRIPLIRQTVQEFFEKEPLCHLHPDECVALGASVYTQLIDEPTKSRFGMKSMPEDILGEDMVVVPRTAHSLGIGVDEGGNRFSIILARGSFYPISVTKKDYYTVVEDQKGIEFWAYEGEDPIATKNTPLGLIQLDFPPGLPAGVPIWITFTMNASRILEVAVQLPDYPDLKIQVKVEMDQAASANSPQNHITHTLENIKEMLRKLGNHIDQSREAQVRWAIGDIERLIESGDMELAEKKLKSLGHIREELSLMEKDIHDA